MEGGLVPGQVLVSLPVSGALTTTLTFTAPTGVFYLRVHAVAGTIRSGPSNEIKIHVTVPVAPSAPTGLLGLAHGSSLALAWPNTFEGGSPTGVVLDVTGAYSTSISLPVSEQFAFVGVPLGTYTFAVRAFNAAGVSPASNTVTLSFPGACTPPSVPTRLSAVKSGSTITAAWAPPASGGAPTGYVLMVTGSVVGSFPTTARTLSGTVGAGTYTLSVIATNPCGTCAPTAGQTVTIPRTDCFD